MNERHSQINHPKDSNQKSQLRFFQLAEILKGTEGAIFPELLSYPTPDIVFIYFAGDPVEGVSGDFDFDE